MGANSSRAQDAPPQQARQQAGHPGLYFTPEQMNSMFYDGYPPPIPQAPPPVVHSARTVRNDVNVKRDSITFTPASPGSKTCFLSFKFDAARPCTATVYFCATETTNGDNVTTKLVPKRASSGMTRRAYFDKGMNQTYSQSEQKESGVDTGKYGKSGLSYKGSAPNTYPVVILLEACDTPMDGAAPGRTEFPDARTTQSQLTYASLERQSDGTWSVRVLKQKIQVYGQAFELQAIYGIERGGTGDDACVVCLSNPKDTTVLPCRHMCLCRECAEQLRLQTNKCPICRAPVESLLKIDLEQARRRSGDGDDTGAGSGPAPAAAPAPAAGGASNASAAHAEP